MHTDINTRVAIRLEDTSYCKYDEHMNLVSGDLSSLGITNAELPELINYFANVYRSVASLSFRDNKIDDAGAKLLLDAVHAGRFPKLKSLDLTGNTGMVKLTNSDIEAALSSNDERKRLSDERKEIDRISGTSRTMVTQELPEENWTATTPNWKNAHTRVFADQTPQDRIRGAFSKNDR